MLARDLVSADQAMFTTLKQSLLDAEAAAHVDGPVARRGGGGQAAAHVARQRERRFVGGASPGGDADAGRHHALSRSSRPGCLGPGVDDRHPRARAWRADRHRAQRRGTSSAAGRHRSSCLDLDAPVRRPGRSGVCPATRSRRVDAGAGGAAQSACAAVSLPMTPAEVTVIMITSSFIRWRTALALALLALTAHGAERAAAQTLKIGVTLHPYFSWTKNVVGTLPGYEVRPILAGRDRRRRLPAAARGHQEAHRSRRHRRQRHRPRRLHLPDDQGVGEHEDRRHPAQRRDAADQVGARHRASTPTRSSRSPTRSSRPTPSRRRWRRCGRRMPPRCSRMRRTTRAGCA